MESFNRVERGYDPEEVNSFLDQVIEKVELLVEDLEKKDALIKQYQSEITRLKENNGNLDSTINETIIMAQKTSEQLKLAAHRQSEVIIEEAKNNANRIVNEALLKAERTEDEAALLKRNIRIFKKRVRDIIETQLEVVGELDQIDL